MQRPAGVTRGHRGLRALHTAMRIVLVAALVVLLTLIAVHELRGLSVVASGGTAASVGPAGVLLLPGAEAAA